MVQGEIPTNPADLTLSETGGGVEVTGTDNPPSHKFICEVKAEVKSKVLTKANDDIYTHIRTLVKQGKFLELTHLEKNDATWQSFIFNLPKGTMKFVLNSSIDTLPTKVNLKQWGKITNDKCHCGKRQTLNHVLNCCNRSLNEGRYTFRHDCVLQYISQCLDKQKYQCFVDIEGEQTAAGGTLPPSIVVSNLKPDLVIVSKKEKSVSIFELTVPAEHRIEAAHKLKTEKYQHFLTDIKSFKPSVTPFEIGSHTGFVSTSNRRNLTEIHKFCKPSIKLKKFIQNISAITILGSYYIFNCRNQEIWDNPENIHSPFPKQ